jgi:DNA-binding MarR family transcriptional regulator
MNCLADPKSFEAARAKDRPDVQVFTEIGIIDQLVSARLERSLPDGMSNAQFRVLTHFCRRGGAETPAQLARAFQITKGAMTNTLQRLEAQGFVEIVGDETDGRRKLVTLTPAGAAAYEQAITALRPYYGTLREAFTPEEFSGALPFLKALRGWLDENR